MSLPLHYYLELAGETHQVRKLSGREQMSHPTRIELELHLDKGVEVDPDDVVKKQAALQLTRERAERTITGIVSDVTVSATATGTPVLWLMLEAKFALLRYKQNVKAYLHKHVVAIVTEVLDESNVGYELRLGANYPVRPYTVQYRESDFHFVSRMLEEEGIFYFFDEAGVMILGDGVGAYDPAGPIPFRHEANMDQHEDAVFLMGPRSRATPSRVTLRDWTEDAPSRPMDVHADGPTPAGPEWYDYPGEYREPGSGQRIADRYAQALNCYASSYLGRSSAARFAVGRVFEMSEAPLGLDDRGYVLTAIDHDYDITRRGFTLDFEALDDDMAFAPMIEHEEPMLPNPLVGHVTGPEGADIHCDELGRVKVHFPWDRLQPRDDTCSHWVPVMQDNLAHSVSTPRVGWEVLVHFMEGDPDRPVVLGRVYNAEDPFYTSLPDKKTVSSLRSLSSPTRDGNNEIEFEDLQGNEYIKLTAERNQDVVIERNRMEHIQSLETHEVDHDEVIEIGNDETMVVHKDDSAPYVEGNHDLTIGSNRKRDVADQDTTTVGGNRTMSIGGMYSLRVGNTASVAAANIKQSVGGVILEASVKPNGYNAAKAFVNVVGGLELDLAGNERLEDASKAAIDLVGGVYFAKSKDKLNINCNENRVTLVGGVMKMSAVEDMTISGDKVLSLTSGSGGVSGGELLLLEIGDSVISMKDGQVTMSTASKIEFKLSGSSDLGAGESGHN